MLLFPRSFNQTFSISFEFIMVIKFFMFSSSRIAAQLVSGIGFLGAGIILKSEADERITNLTTAAAIWFAASIGMAIGFNFYFMAVVAIAFAVLVPRIPHISKLKSSDR